MDGRALLIVAAIVIFAVVAVLVLRHRLTRMSVSVPGAKVDLEAVPPPAPVKRVTELQQGHVFERMVLWRSAFNVSGRVPKRFRRIFAYRTKVKASDGPPDQPPK